jgi:hypothetical protein
MTVPKSTLYNRYSTTLAAIDPGAQYRENRSREHSSDNAIWKQKARAHEGRALSNNQAKS